MAGRPKLLALCKRIAETEDLEEEIFEAIAEGHPIQKVCEMFDISSRKMLYDWKKQVKDGEVKFKAARKIAAEAQAEKALDELDLDSELLTGPEVSLAIGRSKYRQWLASVYDRDTFGAKDQGVINLNFGDLHMAALQSPGARPTRHQEIPEAEYVEIEKSGVVSNDDEADAQTGANEGPNVPLSVPDGLAPELGGLV